MICEQDRPTMEQVDAIEAAALNLYDSPTQLSCAERVARARKLFELSLVGFRSKGPMADLATGGLVLHKLGVIPAAAACLGTVIELANALNALEREQQSNLKPLQTDNETGDKDVL